MQLGKVALIGVGLLGGSLGRALRKRGRAQEVVGFARRPETISACEQTGATDRTTMDLQDAVSEADIVVLSTPLGEMAAISRRMLPALASSAVVTDVGSVKASVVADLEALIASSGASFVGSHPMAGSEKSGVLAAQSDLFEAVVCVLTPTPRTQPAALAKVRALWEAVGARVLELSSEAHDVLVSRSSHLPHIVATELANFVLTPDRPREQRDLCATGFKSTTRLASGSPEMWCDIALANRAALICALASYREGLADFQRMLEAGDGPALLKYFAQAKERRDSLCPPNTSVSIEPRTVR